MQAKEIDRFRQILQGKKAELIALIQKTENYGREADNESETMDIADKATSSYTKEFMFSKSNNDRQLMQMITEALARIEEGAFGECLNCGEDVEIRRLEAVPWARLCKNCQELAEEGRI
ncbi:MAG: TraR/DksA family transcriptional regulator [Acidobacteriota bacterium]